MENYRTLTEAEIINLEKNGCRCLDHWDNTVVQDPFDASRFRNVTFSGSNQIGASNLQLVNKNNISSRCGIYNSHIDNCSIEENVLINNVKLLSHYNIQPQVIIENTNEIITNGESTFGNGTIVSPVNEAGGREVTIYNELSAHTAFLLCFYRHFPELISSIESAISEYIQAKVKSNKGCIKKHSQIYNSNSLININIGEYCTIEGTSSLINGSINSTKINPCYIGHHTMARDFIMSQGSILSNAANIKHCFIGESSEISNNFYAENSLFFANSQCLLGEACSIFAGPYTVTHHRSTLLIAGNFSFFNAGSSTNQSNHMYKLGPVHQGIMERGCKTGSGSYVLWPAKIGAFTLVLGKHYNNPDISELPFSYLLEDSGKSTIMPAQNMFTVGTIRDIDKWAKRDKRKGAEHLDHIVTDGLNPFTIEKILRAIDVLKNLSLKIKPETKTILYKGTLISSGSVNRGIKLYEQILIYYIGQVIVEQLSSDTKLANDKNESIEKWIDLSGLPIKESTLQSFIKKACSKTNTEELSSFFKECATNYPKLLVENAIQVAQHYFGYDLSSTDSLSAFLQLYIENNQKCKNAIIADAKKEFNEKTKIGFGIYGDSDIKNMDFEATRGKIEENSFINKIENQFSEVEIRTKEILSRL